MTLSSVVGRCDWEGANAIASAAFRIGPQVAIGVDWHSALLFRKLHPLIEAKLGLQVPYVYLNYRVYSRGTGHDIQLVKRLRHSEPVLMFACCKFHLITRGDCCRAEALAVEMSIATIVLAADDADYIKEHFLHGHSVSLRGVISGVPLLAAVVEACLNCPVRMFRPRSLMARTSCYQA